MIRLAELHRDNWEVCAALRVTPEQSDFIASNLHSIAEAQFLIGFSSLAIYQEDIAVGYALFGLDPDDGMYWIYRLMIDERYQNLGYGSTAIRQVVEVVKERPDRTSLIRLGYHPDNEAARRLYAKVGFTEEGLAPWGEMIAAYPLTEKKEGIQP
ncbi:GNAT family N-acetyltransferase [Saccharibacillus sacchari]|uniref:GNAT family N-acetyltransferase n=1 Tax=Saccharibacillus sacchari TaxID=456493 RepID=UPI0004AE5997|nr:GNAT family N-acetyltransferase [Saccharibacillus sacchari]